MKKNVLIFGSVAGFIVSAFMVFGTMACYHDPSFTGSMFIGYASMLLAFSFVFVGIKNYRDKYNGGLITFGKAFKIGLLISLIASTFYVVTWLIEYYFFVPDFMDRFSEYNIKMSQDSGASAAEIDATAQQMEQYKELYKNPVFVVLLTYAEILPVGLLVTLLCAAILKRKVQKA